MKTPTDSLGVEMPTSELLLRRAKLTAHFLIMKGGENFARLEKAYQRENGDETLLITLIVERPQRRVHDIHAEEQVLIIFTEEDNAPPCVVPFREDFPNVPHLMIGSPRMTRPLCLYEEPWEHARIHWTPSRFIQRIHFWLTRTAEGILHAEDQPLEPLLAGSEGWLVCSDALIADAVAKRSTVKLCRAPAENGERPLLFAVKDAGHPRLKVTNLALVVECLPQLHGIIRMKPGSLRDLIEYSVEAGADLKAILRDTLKGWFMEHPVQSFYKLNLLILLVLPKMRVEGGAVQSTEYRAFITVKSIQDIGVALDVYEVREGNVGLMLNPEDCNELKLSEIKLGMVDCIPEFDAKFAATLTGKMQVDETILLVGAGAIGSQVAINLARAGLNKWCILDGDVLLPHNLARHALDQRSVGINKAVALCDAIIGILPEAQVKFVAADLFLRRGDDDQANQWKGSSLVLDCSASMPVSRHLAESDKFPRCISIFLSPNGRSLCVLCEDAERVHRLDWLEMVQYRAVLEHNELQDFYKNLDGKTRYGASCRDVTSFIAQHHVGTWAALCCRFVRDAVQDEEAKVIIASDSGGGESKIMAVNIAPAIKCQLGEWLVQTDHILLEKLERMRAEKLPTETGGTLVGAFDMDRQICYLVDALPAPPDSIEAPDGFNRGMAGLRERIASVEKITASQLTYIGEWHSHPDDCPASPSSDDVNLHQWLAGHMQFDGLPGVMLIIGDRDWSVVL